MDASQFDRFTASLPRRSVTGGLLALVLGVSATEAKKEEVFALQEAEKGHVQEEQA